MDDVSTALCLHHIAGGLAGMEFLNMTTDEQARKIAAGLSEAQRNCVTRAQGPDEDGLFWFPLGGARGVPIELKQRTLIGHCLTPLGLAVRKVLQDA